MQIAHVSGNYVLVVQPVDVAPHRLPTVHVRASVCPVTSTLHCMCIYIYIHVH